jgi:uncharacterized membrane protein YbhN (UPF0104 family)
MVACLDWFLGAAVFATLCSPSKLGFFTLVAVYMLASFSGLASQLPGGLGAFESVALVALAGAGPTADAVAALFCFRVIYYFIPFAIAAVVWAIFESRCIIFRRAASARNAITAQMHHSSIQEGSWA